MLAVLMPGKQPQFGKVRPRERGEGFRIDVRPYGWIGTLAGSPMSRELAEELLKSIRVEIARGKPPLDAVAPYLSIRAKPNLVTERYADWLAVKRQQVEAGERSPRTVQEYERYARPSGEVEWWEGRGIQEVDFALLEDWDLWMADQGKSAKTRRNVLGAFRSFLGWLRKRKAIQSVPEFPAPRVPEHQPKIITLAEQEAVLAEIPEDERGPYLVAVFMGLRPGEIRALTFGDVLLDQDPPILVVSKAMKGLGADAPIAGTKTGYARRLPIAPEVVRWLRTHLPESIPDAAAPLFTNPRTGKRWRHWVLREIWVGAAGRAGVDVGLYEGTKHAFATAALHRTGNERAVQEYLGHRDPRSTRRYAKLADEALADVVRPRTVH